MATGRGGERSVTKWGGGEGRRGEDSKRGFFFRGAIIDAPSLTVGREFREGQGVRRGRAGEGNCGKSREQSDGGEEPSHGQAFRQGWVWRWRGQRVGRWTGIVKESGGKFTWELGRTPSEEREGGKSLVEE